MNLSRSFLSWELRSVSIAYGNLKHSTGVGMKCQGFKCAKNFVGVVVN